MAITRTNIGNLWFNYRGDYDNSTSYKKDDVVIWNNTDYLMVEKNHQQQEKDLNKILNIITMLKLQMIYIRFN